MGHLRHQDGQLPGQCQKVVWNVHDESSVECIDMSEEGVDMSEAGVEYDTVSCWDEIDISCEGSEWDSDFDVPVGTQCQGEVEVAPEFSVPTVVKGRLKERLGFWKNELQAPASIINIIEQGYLLPLKSEPFPKVSKNQASALANTEFIDQSVSELLEAGCMRVVDSAPHVCSPLAVAAKRGEKKRLP